MRTLFTCLRTMSALAILVAVPGLSRAQSGRISGTVVDANGQRLANAQVLVPIVGLSAESDDAGMFVVRGVPSGTYALRVYRVGYKPRDVSAVTVTPGRATTVAISMEPAPVQLSGIVVSVSRRVQKITDAPATVVRLEPPQIENTIGNSFLPALKQVNGIEFVQEGISSIVTNARGFNSSFNNRMLMMEDGRIATLPESGLPVGSQTTIPKVDLAGIEVLVGPGAALYGPDASNGVLTLETKDPKQYQGWTTDISGGSRQFRDVQGRFATVRGRLGFKMSGEYQAANDWSNSVFYPAITSGGQPIAEKNPDFNTNLARASGTVAWYPANGGRLQATAATSRINSIGQTSVGRNQLVNYDYRNYQVQYTGDRWFAQAYMTNGLSHGTFALNAFSQNSVRFPSLTPDSLKKLSAFPADGRLQAAEIQNNFVFGSLGKTGVSAIDDAHLVWGAQVRRDRVSTYQHWLSDRKTGRPIVNNQIGEYAQLESPLTGQLSVVAAARYDRHDKYAAQLSPKVALLFTPVPDQTIRVTFNRAFKSPTVLQTDFYYPNFQPFVGIFGNADGFDVKKNDGTLVNIINAIRPETNTTWELGYKGALANRMFVDAAVYRAKYKDFLSPVVVIANPLAPTTASSFPTTAYNHRTGAKVTDESGGPQIALTYFNVGEAVIAGFETGVRYYVTDGIAAWTNVNLIRVDTIKSQPSDPVEATKFNSSSVRISTGMDFHELTANTSAGFTARYVNGYDFRSGVNFGHIPSFAALDLTASYALSDSPVSVTLQMQNVFACVSGTSIPPAAGISSSSTTGMATYTGRQQCGIGQSHLEMINMPATGAMVFLGVRIQDRRGGATASRQ